MSKVQQAVSLFNEGLLCSQALLSTYGPELGLDREIALKLATAFGGGMCRMGETCGAVARALMLNPRLLMMDEPSFGLAPLVKRLLTDIFREIREEGITIFLAEQDALLALETADRSYVLENGRIAIEGRREELITDPHVKEAYLGLA